MQSEYHRSAGQPPLHQSFVAPSLPSPSSSLMDAEFNCCACSPCCLPGQCCARSGACPCFCAPTTALFSTSLVSFFLAMTALATGTGLGQYFSVRIEWWRPTATVGPWQMCSDSVCGSVDLSLFNAAMFDAFRALLTIATAGCLITGLLAAVRLGVQQRGKEVGSTLEAATWLSAVLAWVTTTVSFALATAVPGTSGAQPTLQMSWYCHLVALVFATYGAIAHCATLACSKGASLQRQALLAGGNVDSASPALYYPAAFAHPAPLSYIGVSPAHGYRQTAGEGPRDEPMYIA